MKNKFLLNSLKDLSWYLFAILFVKILQFIFIPFVVKSFDYTGFAEYDLFLTYASFFSAFVCLGIDSGIAVIIINNRENREIIAKNVSTGILVVIFISVCCFLLLLFGKFIFSFKILLYVFVIVYGALMAIQNILSGIYKWEGEVNKSVTTTLLCGTLGYLTGGVSLYFYKNLNLFIIFIILGTSLGVFLSLYLSKKYIDIRQYSKIDFSEVRKLINTSSPSILGSLGVQSRRIFERLLVNHFFGFEILGQFSVISRIVQIFDLGMQTLGNVVLPKILGIVNPVAARVTAVRVQYFYLIIFLFLISASIFFNKEIITVFSGGIANPLANLLAPMLCFTIINSFYYFSGFSFIIKDKLKVGSLIILIFTIFSYLCSFFILQYNTNLISFLLVTNIFSFLMMICFIIFNEKFQQFYTRKSTIIFVVSLVFFVLISFFSLY